MSDANGSPITIALLDKSVDALSEAFADEAAIDSLLQSDILFEVASGKTLEDIAKERQLPVEEVKNLFSVQARRWRQARDALVDMLYTFDIARIEVLLSRLMRLAAHDEENLKKLSQVIVDIIMKKSMISMGISYASQVRNSAAIRTDSVRAKLQMLEAKIRSWDSDTVVRKSLDSKSEVNKECQVEKGSGIFSS